MAEDIAAYEKLGAFYLGRPRDADGERCRRRRCSTTPAIC